jgi:molybdopterin synthase sulfur carrier subunit
MPLIKLYANLRKLAGTKEISMPGATVREALNELVTQYPALAGAILDKDEPRAFVVITLNGHNVTELNTLIDEEDIVAVFPPLAGG